MKSACNDSPTLKQVIHTKRKVIHNWSGKKFSSKEKEKISEICIKEKHERERFLLIASDGGDDVSLAD